MVVVSGSTGRRKMARKGIPQSDEAYAQDAHLQWWYFDAIFEDGHRLLTYFLPGFRGTIENQVLDQPFLNVVLRRPDGEIIREPRSFPPSEFLAKKGDFGASFGEDCSVTFEKGASQKGLGCYNLKAKAGRLGYALTLLPDIPPWSPFGRRARVPRWGMMLARRSISTRDYFHYAPFVPRGRMEGRITLDDESFQVGGKGYHEHGRLNFPLYELTEAWYWLHIEHSPWTILTGTAVHPPGYLKPKKETRGGFGFVQEEGKCLLAVGDPSGLLVNWKRIDKQVPQADGDVNMAWDADVRLARPGLVINASVRSSEVLECMPFYYHEETPVTPYWSQSIARAEVRVLQGAKRATFESECVLETMVSGGTGDLRALRTADRAR
jgi:hypothetical protein